jgi:hypothetical protein
MSSNVIRPSREFIRQFADWEWLLRSDGQSSVSIELLKQCIREDWNDPELRAQWEAIARERSEFRQELVAMASGITERIKSNIAQRKAAAGAGAKPQLGES